MIIDYHPQYGDASGPRYFAFTIGRCVVDPWAYVVVLINIESGIPIYFCWECSVALKDLPPDSSPEANCPWEEDGTFEEGDRLVTDHYDTPLFNLEDLAAEGARWAKAADIEKLHLDRARLTDIGAFTFEGVEAEISKLSRD